MAEEKKEEEKKEETSKGGNKDIEENKVFAAISYLGILCLIPLLAKKDSPYAQYHAKQGLVYLIAIIVAQFGWLLYWIPILGWLVALAVYVFLFILFIMGMVNALSGKMKPLPLIGKFGETLKI